MTVISNRNYFLFTPLLPSAAVGTIDGSALVEPVRGIVGRHQGRFFQAAVTDVADQEKQVVCEDASGRAFRVDYDKLVVRCLVARSLFAHRAFLLFRLAQLAIGARCVTFGVPGVEEYCFFLKSLEDTRAIRKRVMHLFEQASLPHLTQQERRALLSFVVVGWTLFDLSRPKCDPKPCSLSLSGGPTGVEVAAELEDLVHVDMNKLYPMLRDDVSVTLVHSSDHVLNGYDVAISKYAEVTPEKESKRRKSQYHR